jgi:hypothetical protein
LKLGPGDVYKNMYEGITDLIEIGKNFGNFLKKTSLGLFLPAALNCSESAVF